ncbi:hypothetical protein [Sediminibacillus terrae]|uniref:hypothetical protein n=1 Tax=Sediminibacillus terrae TaxID=1562106 RepID=UPI001296CB75|nr:hypothetical protein [Sediminibacillus terrae]
MERIQQRFQAAANALKAFKKLVIIENPDDIERDEAIAALSMVDDRNLIVHTYNEEVAIKIYKNLNHHYFLLDSWLSRMAEKTE